MKKLLIFLILTLGNTQIHAQTKVITLTPAGRQKVIDLDSIYLAKGQVSFFEGTETGAMLMNADKMSALKMWTPPDTIQLNNGRISRIVFVFQENLGSLANDWTAYLTSDATKSTLGIYKTDSSQTINIGGVPHRQYIEYWAPMKYKLGAINSAGVKRRVVLNGYYSPNNPSWPSLIPYIETRRWRKPL